jgi:hypothetical protein
MLRFALITTTMRVYLRLQGNRSTQKWCIDPDFALALLQILLRLGKQTDHYKSALIVFISILN